jgi:hypothetical protein
MKLELGNSTRVAKKQPKSDQPAKGADRPLVPNSWLGRIRLAIRALRGLPLGPTDKGVEFRYADMRMVYDAYFETTLMASLLRTFDGVDVRMTGLDDVFEKKLKIANPERAYQGAVTELAYAAIGGKIPIKTIRETLDRWKHNDKWFRMLLAIMDAVETK